jgi:hypothetical protein
MLSPRHSGTVADALCQRCHTAAAHLPYLIFYCCNANAKVRAFCRLALLMTYQGNARINAKMQLL